jgi:hypothetical protein
MIDEMTKAVAEDSNENRDSCRLEKRYTVVCVTCRSAISFFTSNDKQKIEDDLIEHGWTARGSGRWSGCWACPDCIGHTSRAS